MALFGQRFSVYGSLRGVGGLGDVAGFGCRGGLQRDSGQAKQCLLHIHGALESVFGTHIEGVIDCGEEVMAVAAFVAAVCQLGLGVFAGDAGGGFFIPPVGYGLLDTGAEAV